MILCKGPLRVDNDPRVARDLLSPQNLADPLSLFPHIDDLTISPNLLEEEISRPGLWGNDDDGIQCISPPLFRGSFKFLDLSSLDHWGFYRDRVLRSLVASSLQSHTGSLDIIGQSWGES